MSNDATPLKGSQRELIEAVRHAVENLQPQAESVQPKEDLKVEEDLSPQQEAAIVALMESSTYAAVANRVGVNVSTLRRWILRDPAFRSRLREARQATFGLAVRALHSASPEAADVLRSIAQQAEAPPSSRVSAARALLQYSCRGREMDDLNERVAELEERIETLVGFLATNGSDGDQPEDQ